MEEIEIGQKYNCNVNGRLLTCTIYSKEKGFFGGTHYKGYFIKEVYDIQYKKILYSEKICITINPKDIIEKVIEDKLNNK